MIARPQPVAETAETVTYAKADIDRLFENCATRRSLPMIARPQPVAETEETITYARADIDQLFDALEDLEARATFVATRAEEKLPADVVRRLCEGDRPVWVFREYRGLSADELAARAGLSRSHLSEIERGRKSGSSAALAALAAALDVTVDELVP